VNPAADGVPTVQQSVHARRSSAGDRIGNGEGTTGSVLESKPKGSDPSGGRFSRVELVFAPVRWLTSPRLAQRDAHGVKFEPRCRGAKALTVPVN
jgi:hypothetical protein